MVLLIDYKAKRAGEKHPNTVPIFRSWPKYPTFNNTESHFFVKASKLQFVTSNLGPFTLSLQDRSVGSTDVSEARLNKLFSLQCKMLRHALSFPNVKRVSYSTCSVEKKENEEVQ